MKAIRFVAVGLVVLVGCSDAPDKPEAKQVAPAFRLVVVFVRLSGVQDLRVIEKLDVAGTEVPADVHLQ